MILPESTQQDGESLQDWIKRRNKAAMEGIETRKEEEAKRLEDERLEKERLEKERQDKVRGSLKQPLKLSPPGEEEVAPVEAAREAIDEVLEEATGEPTQIRVPEGFEVTRFIYDKDGEPTSVYIDRKMRFNSWGPLLAAFCIGAIVGLLFNVVIGYFTGAV